MLAATRALAYLSVQASSVPQAGARKHDAVMAAACGSLGTQVCSARVANRKAAGRIDGACTRVHAHACARHDAPAKTGVMRRCGLCVPTVSTMSSRASSESDSQLVS